MGVPSEKAAEIAASVERDIEYLAANIHPEDILLEDRDRLAQACVKLELYIRDVWSPSRYIFESSGKPL